MFTDCDVKEQRKQQKHGWPSFSFSGAEAANQSIKGTPLFREVRKIRMGEQALVVHSVMLGRPSKRALLDTHINQSICTGSHHSITAAGVHLYIPTGLLFAYGISSCFVILLAWSHLIYVAAITAMLCQGKQCILVITDLTAVTNQLRQSCFCPPAGAARGPSLCIRCLTSQARRSSR
jgi:hypothetical protein